MDDNVIARGLAFPEGPLQTTDGRTLFVQIGTGQVSEVYDGEVRQAAYVGGAPHAVIEGADACLYVAQSGSVVIGEHHTLDPVPPGIQRVDPDGSVAYVVRDSERQRVHTPNDLCFGPDGKLYFTDTGGSFNPGATNQMARILAVDSDGGVTVVLELGSVFCNGISFDRQDRLVWTETYGGVVCRLEHGERRVVGKVGDGIFSDGVKTTQDGRLFVAATNRASIVVFDEQGEEVDEFTAESFVTNLNFSGSTLMVTDFGDWVGDWRNNGTLRVFDTDVSAQIVHMGRVEALS